MDQGQLMALTATWANLLPEGTLVGIQKWLEKLPDDKASMLATIQFKTPMTGLICGIIGGVVGVDRFYKGDIGMGIAKICTLGGLYIWWLADLFFVQKGIKVDNLNKLNMMLMQLGV
ncbi:MAG: TM2 domain-containing protein [Helicobacter sp.]|uniref:TM2 domain-containing protein n=1 Tax=Helicobacter sp. TaxID=218 RepID=UPI002A9087DA|nr:TM2 domain-containing protein [Helicobacter sp.]MDY5949831.1 TM2 domain-containing protein [Helicobacter sp.]